METDWRTAIQNSTYKHRTLEEIEKCSNDHTKISNFGHTDVEDLKLFYMSLHAMYMFYCKHLTDLQYHAMCDELHLLHGPILRHLDKIGFSKWPVKIDEIIGTRKYSRVDESKLAWCRYGKLACKNKLCR